MGPVALFRRAWGPFSITAGDFYFQYFILSRGLSAPFTLRQRAFFLYSAGFLFLKAFGKRGLRPLLVRAQGPNG